MTTFVQSFSSVTPPPRFDGIHWIQVEIRESSTRTGVFTLIDTQTIPVDPTPDTPNPIPITTTHATLAEGWYSFQFIDGIGNFSDLTNAVFAPVDPNLELRPGPCDPWVDGPTVAALPWVAQAAAAAVSKGWVTTDQIAGVCADAATAASEVLYEMSGRVFTGQCGPVKVRPVARPTDIDSKAWIGSYGWVPSWGGCVWGWGSDAVSSHFGCSNPPEIELGVYPVNNILEVKIDGVVIPSDEYELRDNRTLVRMRTSVNEQPTQRYGWPTCQANDLPDTEQGTFSVVYTYGQLPPTSGLLAVRKLAEYLALPQLGDNTKYPQRVTSVQRQGVSSMVVDVMDIVKTGKTGIYEVDLFLRSVNPEQHSRQSAVWSPDLGRARRTPN